MAKGDLASLCFYLASINIIARLTSCYGKKVYIEVIKHHIKDDRREYWSRLSR